ncbi:MAG: tRNA (adenosine(37)-N6)-threonylcarbamoyltransferase complex ATPase subunit type 1 TsaE [Mucilaginibacter sp.]
MILTATSPNQLPSVAAQVVAFANDTRIFLFYGDMGAGKTTLIKSICHVLGSNDNITSPTFAIVNEYSAGTDKLYHFDFYRLKDQTEAMDMGCEEYFYSGRYCFIEWPEKIPDVLPEHFIRVQITVDPNGARLITLDKF